MKYHENFKLLDLVRPHLGSQNGMAILLGNLIRRYEAANGTIDISALQPGNEERMKIQ